MPKQNNKYNLDPILDQKNESTVLSIDVKYYVPEDEMHASVSIRKDAVDTDLVIRLIRGLEQALRKVSPEYNEDLELLEAAAKAYLGGVEESETETDGFRHSKDDSEQPAERGCC